MNETKDPSNLADALIRAGEPVEAARHRARTTAENLLYKLRRRLEPDLSVAELAAFDQMRFEIASAAGNGRRSTATASRYAIDAQVAGVMHLIGLLQLEGIRTTISYCRESAVRESEPETIPVFTIVLSHDW